MKKFFAFSIVIFAMLFFVSCVEGDDEESSDTVSGDTQPSDDTIPSDPSDTGDTETTPADSSDTGSSDTGDTGSTDTGDSGSSDTGDTGSTDTGSTDTGSDTGDSAPVPEPEPEPIKCTGFSIDPASFRYENGEYHATIPDIADSDESLEDELVIEFRLYDDPQVKTYKLYYDQDDYTSYHNGSYLECDQCVSVFQDIKDGKPTKHFFQESGTLEITETDDSNGIKGSLTAKLVEVTLDKEGESTPVTRGACFEVEGLLFDNITE